MMPERAGLPDLVATLEAEWSITTGACLAGGNFAYVCEAVTSDGRPAVLKVAPPPSGIDGWPSFEQELAALRLAGGDPYAELLRYDVPRRSLLLERLGQPMARLGWPIARQLDALVRTVARGWCPVPVGKLPVGKLPVGQLPSGAAKARWLADYVTSAWEELGRPCPEATAAQAIRYAAEREAAFDPRHAVLVHGDAHVWNLLRVPGTSGFRLIDPEGLISEPAHDLGVILRDWNEDLVTREPGEALRISRRRCQRAGRLTAVDPEAIWQWAFIERVSSGLFMLRLGHTRAAETFLAVAGKLTTIWGSNHD